MVDARELAAEARGPGNGESYRVLFRTSGVRIAVGARGRSRIAYFVEAVLDPFPRRPDVDVSALEGIARRVRRLAARGYTVRCEDDGRLTCEKTVPPRELTREAAEVQGTAGRAVTGGP